MANSIIGKIILISCFVLLSAGILAAWNSPATGFETSIYISTPSLFWIAVSVCIIIGVTGVIRHITDKREPDSGFPMVPILLIFLSFAAILSLFIIRGYALWASGDPLTHLGNIRNIIDTGHNGNTNYYPITHIYIAQISEVTEISITTLSKLMPLLFAMLSVPFTYCLAKAVLREKGQIILATMFSMILLGTWYLDLTPNILANFVSPLFLYVLFKCLSSKELQWRILSAVLILVFPIFHIIPAAVILLILLSFPIANRIFGGQKHTDLPEYFDISSFSYNSAIFLFVWGATWISSFTIADYELTTFYDVITGYRQSQLTSLITDINYASGYHYSVIGVFIKTNGGLAILIILTLIAIAILWKKRDFSHDYRLLGLLTVPLGAIALAVMALYIVNLDFPPLRLLVYIRIICGLFTAYILLQAIGSKRDGFRGINTTLRASIVGVVIVGLFALGGLAIYPSKYIYGVSSQITQTEINGMDWFLHNGNSKENHTYLSETAFRFADLLLTPDERSKRTDISYSLVNHTELKIPFHFGYDKSEYFGSSYQQNLYFVVNQLDRSIYQDVYPEMAKIRFEPQDFSQLETDPSVDKLYTNAGFDTFFIHGLANP
jgi:hypothetical protein